jgi:hypothetical protein
MHAPPVLTTKEERKSLPPKESVAVRPNTMDSTLTAVITGGKPVLPPQPVKTPVIAVAAATVANTLLNIIFNFLSFAITHPAQLLNRPL